MTKPSRGDCLHKDPGTVELIKKAFSDINVEMMLTVAKQDICPTCTLYLMIRTLVADFDDVTKRIDALEITQIAIAAITDHFDIDAKIKVVQ